MHKRISYYDCAIIGGGLAGLSLATWLGRNGFRVVVYEKRTYPFHKVCGEYLAMESVASLSGLGVPLSSWDLPRIQKLLLSSPDGAVLTRGLQPGGIGVSRYMLDSALAAGARTCGVEIREGTKVEGVRFEKGTFQIGTSEGSVRARVCCASFGRHSNFDRKWKRGQNRGASDRYVGVKYHARLDKPDDVIELHCFHRGYCGISPVEEGKHCICYLTSEKKLRAAGNTITRLEERIRSENPLLGKALREAVMLTGRPVTVSQIGFSPRNRVNDHVLMLGDAAGMIPPLCGNGMSMALHSSKLALDPISRYLQGSISRESMEREYRVRWQSQFADRMRAARMIQSMILQSPLANLLVRTLRPFPGAVDWLIRQTHGPAPF